MKSIQNKISVSIIISALIPLVIMVIFQQREMVKYKDEVSTGFVDIANLMSHSINDYVIERSRDVKILSSLINNNSNNSSISSYLNNVITEVPGIRLLCVEDEYGNVVTKILRDKFGDVKNSSDTHDGCLSEHLKRSNYQSITGISHIVTVYQPGEFISGDNETINVFPISSVLNNDDKSNDYKLYAFIDMASIRDILYSDIRSLKGSGVNDVSMNLLDRYGYVLLHNDKKKRLQHTIEYSFINKINVSNNRFDSGNDMVHTVHESLNGDEYLVTFYRVSEDDDELRLGWSVVLTGSTDELYAYVYEWYSLLVIAVLMIILASVAMGIVLSRIISSPLRSLSKSMNDYTNGIEDSEILELNREDEVGVLAQAFSEMRAYQTHKTDMMESYVSQYQKLICAQDQASKLLMSSPDAMVVVSEDGLIKTINPAANQLFGYDEDELIDKPIEILIPERYKNHSDLRDSFFDKPSFRPMGTARNLMAVRKDGCEVEVSISLSPVESYEGRQVIATIRDESKRIQYETELRKLAAVAENTNNLVIVTDRWGRIEWVNLAFEDKTGYLLHEVRGKKPGEVMQGPDTDKHAIESMRDALRKAEPIRIEVLNYTKDMKPIWLDMNIQPVRGERGIENYISIESDITDRRQLEEDLVHANVNLELRVKERTQQLETALEKADSAAKAKSAFLATMSHEIRTPMNGVLGMLELVQKTSLDDVQKKMLSTVRSSSNALLRIIDDILDFSKIDAGKLKLLNEVVTLFDIADEVVDSLSTLALDKSVEFIVFVDPTLPEFISDPVRIRQILFNLAGNAIKFTDKGGYVAIDITKKHVIDDVIHIEISVKDNGIGIEPEKQLKLFQPFTQADDSTTREFGGTGLGLSICARLVELMEGTIKLDSEPGKGSVFYVEIPLKIADNTISKDISLNNKHVHLILDNEIVRDKLSKVLKQYGAIVHNHASPHIFIDVNNTLKTSNEDGVFLISDLKYDNLKSVEVAKIFKTGNNIPGENSIYLRPYEDDYDYHGGSKQTDNPLHVHQVIKVIDGYESPGEETEVIKEKDNVKTDEIDFTVFNVLVAEDNEINQDLIQLQLDTIGVNSVIAENGLLALEKWSETDFDLILTDCHMPEMDGFALTKEIRRRESEYGYDVTPIIAVTANALNGEADNCTNAGMDDYLSKPLELVSLQAMLEKWLPVSNQSIMTSSSTDENLDPSFPVDINVIKSLVGDDASLISRFYKKFIDTTPDNISQIKASIDKKSIEDIKSQAHKLKSSSKAIGASKITEICIEFEKISSDLDEVYANELLNKLTEEFNKSCMYIDELLENGFGA